MKTTSTDKPCAPTGFAGRTGSAPSLCPQCGDGTIQPRDSAAYCENCGWPDENRPLDPEGVIDEITGNVLDVVSPEGHDSEEWQQVRDAVAKGIAPLLRKPSGHKQQGGA